MEAKYFDLSEASYGITVRVEWREDYDKNTNQTFITITDLKAKSSKYLGVTYFLDGSISVNGTDIITFNHADEKHYLYWEAKDTFASVRVQKGGVLPPWTSAAISQNKVSIDVNLSGYITNKVWTVKGSEAVELTHTGTVYIDSDLYRATIDNGNSFDLYTPFIDNGTEWKIIS